MTGTSLKRHRSVPKRVEWGVSLTLLALILATGGATAQSYISGWDEIESGTESDLLTAEVHAEAFWAFGSSGTILSSGDGGLTWQDRKSVV